MRVIGERGVRGWTMRVLVTRGVDNVQSPWSEGGEQ